MDIEASSLDDSVDMCLISVIELYRLFLTISTPLLQNEKHHQ